MKDCNGNVLIDSAPEFCIPEVCIIQFCIFNSLIMKLQFSCIDLKHVDVILISNYRSMLALPFVTERSEFSGYVYATEPSLHFGRLYMEELVTYIERNPKLKQASAWKNQNIFPHLPFSYFPESILPQNLTTIYTMQEVNSCLSKIKPMAFSEKIVL